MTDSRLVTCSHCGQMAPLATVRVGWFGVTAPATGDRPTRVHRLCSLPCLAGFAASLHAEYERHLAALSLEAQPEPAAAVTLEPEQPRERKRRIRYGKFLERG